jgi:ketosteroid isomerase-like protein
MPEESTTPDLAVLMRRVVDAASARDLDAAMSCYAPDGVYDMSPVGMGLRQGRAAIREHFQEWWGGYEEYEHELEEMRDTGEGVAFCVLVQRGRLPGSTGWVQLRYPAVVTVRDGLIERTTVYSDIDEHRAAAERLARESGQAMAEESTTPDLVELTRRAITSAVEGDFDAAMIVYGPGSVWDTSGLGMSITYEGEGAIREVFEDWTAAYEELEVEIEEIRDLGGGVTLAVSVQNGRPAGSTEHVQMRYASVCEWAGGLIARVTNYFDIDEASAAAERLAEEREA